MSAADSESGSHRSGGEVALEADPHHAGRLPQVVERRLPGHALLGSSYDVLAQGSPIVVYAITDPKHALLTRAGMPSYFARYAFNNDRLAWFRFGFEYP